MTKQFPIIITEYNSSGIMIPKDVVLQELREQTIEKLKGFSIYLAVIKKGEIMLLLFRESVGFPDPIGVEDFCYFSRNDTIVETIDRLLEKFKRLLPNNIRIARDCFGIDAINYKKGTKP